MCKLKRTTRSSNTTNREEIALYRLYKIIVILIKCHVPIYLEYGPFLIPDNGKPWFKNALISKSDFTCVFKPRNTDI